MNNQYIFLILCFLIISYIMYEIMLIREENFTEKEKIKELVKAYQSGNTNYMKLRNELIKSTEVSEDESINKKDRLGEDPNEKPKEASLNSNTISKIQELVGKRKFRLQLYTNIPHSYLEKNEKLKNKFKEELDVKVIKKDNFISKFINEMKINLEDITYDGFKKDNNDFIIVQYSLKDWLSSKDFGKIVEAIKTKKADGSELINVPEFSQFKFLDTETNKYYINRVTLLVNENNFMDVQTKEFKTN